MISLLIICLLSGTFEDGQQCKTVWRFEDRSDCRSREKRLNDYWPTNAEWFCVRRPKGSE